MAKIFKTSCKKGFNKLKNDLHFKIRTVFQVLEEKNEQKKLVQINKLKEKQLRQNSPYGHYKSFNVRGFIVKYGDDMR